jgi:hypothetical protein
MACISRRVLFSYHLLLCLASEHCEGKANRRRSNVHSRPTTPTATSPPLCVLPDGAVRVDGSGSICSVEASRTSTPTPGSSASSRSRGLQSDQSDIVRQAWKVMGRDTFMKMLLAEVTSIVDAPNPAEAAALATLMDVECSHPCTRMARTPHGDKVCNMQEVRESHKCEQHRIIANMKEMQLLHFQPLIWHLHGARLQCLHAIYSVNR